MRNNPRTSVPYSFKLSLLLVTLLLPLNIFAQYKDYTQLGLRKGAKVRLGKGTITGDIAYSPDGTRLAIASSVGIWIYDAHTGEELSLLTGHTHSVNSVSFSPDGSTLASGGNAGTVRLWDANTGEPLHTLTGDTSSVNSVSFSPDGSTLASGSDEGTVRLWDANTGEPLLTPGHWGSVSSVSFSPDGSTLASGHNESTRHGDIVAVELRDANTGASLRTLGGQSEFVNSVSFSPDGFYACQWEWWRHGAFVGCCHGKIPPHTQGAYGFCPERILQS